MKVFDILFVGGIFPRDEEKSITEKSSNYIQSAANNCQWRLINGFDHNISKPISILNQMFVGSFPNNYSEAIIKERFFSHAPGAKDINLGFVNIKGIKPFLRPFKEKYYIKKWLSNSKNKRVVFIYSLSNKTVRIAKLIRRIANDVLIVTYVGDLPGNFMKGRQKDFLVKQWISYQSKNVDKHLELIDLFVLVSKEQAICLNLESDKYIIIEAIANTIGSSFVELDSSDTRRVTYAGGLLPQYNIDGLLQAFCKISDPNVSLVIMGDGPEKQKILQAQKNDKRIIYKGVLSQEEAINEMRKASVLVNPTLAGQDFTKVSFPIKIIDYLLAGRPVISQKLEGIPPEYDDYLIYFGDNDSLYDVLVKTLSMDLKQINEIGKKNFDFVIAEKSEIAQTKKILDRVD